MAAQDRDARLQAYLDGATQLTAMMADLPPESLDHRAASDGWSIREILAHLADSEVQAFVRCRVILAEPGTALRNYDQDAWATALGYGETAPGPAVDLFCQLRRINHTLLQDLPDEAWSSSANHELRGLVSLDDWLTIYTGHLETHFKQIEANLAGWRAAES